MQRHNLGYPTRDVYHQASLNNPGEFHWRAGGEQHIWNPQAISDMQLAARTSSREAYDRFAKAANEGPESQCALRGFVRFKAGGAGAPVAIEEVEPAAEIMKQSADPAR